MLHRSLIATLTLLAATALLPAAVHADPPAAPTHPLRIWVMHNEVGAKIEPVSAQTITAFIQNKRVQDNIIIENSVNNLLMDDALDEAYPLANYVMGQNKFLAEIADFQRTHADDGPITVEFIRWNDAFSKISNIAAQNITNAPDVIQIGSTWVATFADQGVVVDVSDHFNTGNFFPPSVASARMFGKKGLFAVPWFVDTRVLYYWKKDITSPSQLATWENFSSTCKASAGSRRGSFIGFPNTISWDLLHNLAPWLWAADGDILEPHLLGPIHRHRVVLNSPKSLAGISYLKGLAQSGCAGFPTVGHTKLEDRFMVGKYSTIITGPWFVKRVGNKWPNQIGITIPPAGTNGSRPFVGGSHLAITSSSHLRGNSQRAIELIRHFTSPAVQQAYADSTGLLPAHREALQSYIGRTGIKAFRQAMEKGKSYPSIIEWGSVVENDLIRNHIWHIWHDIAQNVPDTTLENTVSQAAAALKKKLLISSVKRSAPYTLGLIGGLMFLGTGFMLWWKRRYTTIRRLYEQKTGDLKKLIADRAILEGKTLLLQQCRDKQSDTLHQLERNLSRMKRKAASLTTEIKELTVLRTHADRKTIGIFSIHSDGTLYLDNEPVHFENNRQTRCLIECMTRLATNGATSIHCVWGYALFGWDASKIQTPPQRLFEALVSKINGSLKKRGRPPLIGKTGKRTGAWKLLWNTSTTLENSDINRSLKIADVAAKHVAEGSLGTACENIAEALELDPKNMDALALMRTMRVECPEDFAAHERRLNGLRKVSEKLIDDELCLMSRGIAAVEGMLKGDVLPKGIDSDTAWNEVKTMKFQVEYNRRRFDNIFGKNVALKRLSSFDEVANRLVAVHNKITSLTSTDSPPDHMWAAVVDSDPFAQLMAIPPIQKMVNNFHHRETHEHEDPRLVQLALISSLSSPRILEGITKADSKEDLFAILQRGLHEEMRGLEQQLSAIPLS